MSARILVVTDLHQRAVLYSALVRLCEQSKPDAVILGGDFLHGTGLLPYGRTRQLTPALCAVELQGLSAPVFFVRGNHEDENWFEFRDAWRAMRDRTPNRLNGDLAVIGDAGVVGFPCTMGQETAFSEGRPLGGDHYTHWLDLLLADYGDAARQLWIMHEPPTGTRLSAPGSVVEGYAWWRDAIFEHQPRMVICGHDHLTPMRNGLWRDEIGSTVVINVGQNMDGPLHATLVFHENGLFHADHLVA
ncbi:MAG: metallophosphoesterase [Verrucomicrobiaceae bacterium]|nr:metallophosphoesterase [Verrucomicrobiaceae bacterium]